MKVTVILIVVGAFGTVPRDLAKKTKGIKNQGWNRNYQDYSIIKIGYSKSQELAFHSSSSPEPALDFGSERGSEKEPREDLKPYCSRFLLGYLRVGELDYWLLLTSLDHQTHIALSEGMSYIDQQGSSLSSCLTFPFPYPHFNRPSCHWPCLVGATGK